MHGQPIARHAMALVENFRMTENVGIPYANLL